MKRFQLFILLVAVSAAVTLAQGAEKSQDNRGTEVQPLIIQAVPATPSTEDVKRDQLHATERAEDLADRAAELATRESAERVNRSIAIVTVLIAFATAGILVVQAFAFFRQAAQLHGSVEEMKNATAATQTAARAAERTVEIMNDTARRQLRAYVAVKSNAISKLDEDAKPEGSIWIRNYGQTPAYGFAVSINTSYVMPGEELPAQSAPAFLGHLAPGGEFHATAICPMRLSRPARNQLLMGTTSLFVHGTVRYVDTFGREHFTRFRLKIGGEGEEVVAHLLRSCTEGNDTDDDVSIAALHPL